MSSDRTGGYEVYALLAARMADVSPEVQVERFSLVTTFVLRSVANRARAVGSRGRKGRPQLDVRDLRAQSRRDGRGGDGRTDRALSSAGLSH